MGYPVLGKLKDIDSILRTNRKKIEVLVIAITKLSSEKMQDAVMAAKNSRAKYVALLLRVDCIFIVGLILNVSYLVY